MVRNHLYSVALAGLLLAGLQGITMVGATSATELLTGGILLAGGIAANRAGLKLQPTTFLATMAFAILANLLSSGKTKTDISSLPNLKTSANLNLVTAAGSGVTQRHETEIAPVFNESRSGKSIPRHLLSPPETIFPAETHKEKHVLTFQL